MPLTKTRALYLSISAALYVSTAHAETYVAQLSYARNEPECVGPETDRLKVEVKIAQTEASANYDGKGIKGLSFRDGTFAIGENGIEEAGFEFHGVVINGTIAGIWNYEKAGSVPTETAKFGVQQNGESCRGIFVGRARR